MVTRLSKLFQKIAVLISSHNLSELESFCTDICIIQNGVVIDRDNIKKFKKNKESEYIFEVDSTSKVNKVLKNIRIINDNMFGKITERDKVPDLIKTLIDNNINIYEVRLKELTLEEAFLNKTGGNKID